MSGKLKISVFAVPVLLLGTAAASTVLAGEAFTGLMRSANSWILDHFGPVFSAGGLFFLITCLAVAFSPAGRIRIGGADAVPVLGRFHWFSVTLCTTIAIGILFWGAAEPLYHLHQLPDGAVAETPAVFAMSTLYLHWTLLPYAMYTLAGLMFAVAHFNGGQPFSVHALLFPFRSLQTRVRSEVLDAVCLYALVAGMAASLSGGLLTVAGGAGLMAGIPVSPALLGAAAVLIVGTFVASAVSGLLRGIRTLSFINTALFGVFLLLIALAGPTRAIASAALDGLKAFPADLIPHGLGIRLDQRWLQDWTWFYWANWLAWTPVTALFLGRIAVGYTVRAFVVMNLVLPSLFSAVWMGILGGFSVVADEASQGALWSAVQTGGAEQVIFQLLERLPGGRWTGALFLITAFLSFVTAADSNTAAMSSLCTHQEGAATAEAHGPAWIKVLWGVLIGVFSWGLTAYAGLDGIRLSSVLGGFPVLLLMLAVAVGAWRWMLHPEQHTVK